MISFFFSFFLFKKKANVQRGGKKPFTFRSFGEPLLRTTFKTTKKSVKKADVAHDFCTVLYVVSSGKLLL